MKARNELSHEAAENVAAQALTYIASEPARMARFLESSGVDVAAIRAAAAQPGFLAGVLEFVCDDEELLIAFAQDLEVHPQEVERARNVLGGPRWQRDFA